jgi:catechol 2,3-dioxygenase
MVVKAPRFEHAEILVRDLAQALEFYTDVMGLVEMGREHGTAYLGCGLDTNFDLALRSGGTGVVHFAIRVDDEDHLERERYRLVQNGISFEERGGAEPGQQSALRFQLPSGHLMEYVVVKDNRYLKPSDPAHPRRQGFGPLDADHINLVTPNVRRLTEFLTDVLGFRVSDVSEPEPGFWAAAWTRYGNYHHDIGVTLTEDPTKTLHHIAWTMEGFDHMKRAMDMMAEYGLRMELGPSRHPIGPNLFVYFLEPGGNRFELSAEGAIIDPSTPTAFWRGLAETLDAWGTLHERVPASFFLGS